MVIDNVLVLPISMETPSILGQAVLPDGSFKLTFSGRAGQLFRVLATDNLDGGPVVSWPVVMTGTFGVGGPVITNYVETDSATNQQRFYSIASP